MGLPALRGGFVGGDDHGLALDHVLVNRPSLEHALKLFTIYHRDLYQPLPLLTFAGEFAIGRSLDLFHSGSQSGAWLFHLTNIILHAAVTVFVWFTVRMLHHRVYCSTPRFDGQAAPLRCVQEKVEAQARWTATLASLLFAVHPLNVETVVWINGRMMLLSTLFGLCAILTFFRFLDRPRPLDVVLTLLFVVLSSLSKVRVVLPALMLLVAIMRGDWKRKSFWSLWTCVGAVTALFAWINIRATSQVDLFSKAAEHLLGPRVVRVLLALENYLTHVVWPVGLTSYYPTPAVVAWSDPATLHAIVIDSIAFLALALIAWRIPAGRWGIAWFFIAMGDTLPLVPARNILAADRYMYLPLLGILWVLAALGLHVYDRLANPVKDCRVVDHDRITKSAAQKVAISLLCLLVPILIGTSWYNEWWYETPQRKTERVARIFPDVPRVWQQYAWTLYSQGEYDKAIELVKKELAHDIPEVQSETYQLIGMCRVKQGRIDEGLETLQRALDIDPGNKHGKFRLATVLEELGRYSDALPLYEWLVRIAPTNNRTIYRLAHVYRELGRNADAREMYELELRNNPYEFPATIGLADLDFQQGTPDSLRAAEGRLLELLNWMPENITARVNLAHLYDTLGNTRQAAEHFRMAMDYGFDVIDQALFAHDFFEKRADFATLPAVWNTFLKRTPNDPNGLGFLAWSYLLAGQPDKARSEIVRLGAQARTITMAQATVAMLALEDERDDMVRSLAIPLSTTSDSAARQRLLRALERFDDRKPGNTWTYYLTASLLQAEGQYEAGRAFLDLFTSQCSGPNCAEAARHLQAMFP